MKATLIRSIMTGLALSLAAAHFSHAVSISDSPAYLSAGVPPLVMLDISKDQQLFKKAYNDYSDLDGDGQLETGYKHSVDYYGYFDPYKCYTYTGGRFEPYLPVTTDKYCASGTGWSGNFLNWSTMTRMDAVRKLLYGGYRAAGSDTSSLTVLERAYLPTDAHAFAKYYNGTDINKLTPFTSIATTAPAGSGNGATDSTYGTNGSVTIGTGSKYFRSSAVSVCRGDQVKVAIDASNYMIGYVSAVSGAGQCGTGFTLTVETGGTTGAGSLTTAWTITNLSATGISLCNLTLGATSGANQKSQTNTNPPLLRVASGNFALWASNERWQCYWRAETTSPAAGGYGSTRSNGNRYISSGLAASGYEPNAADHRLGGTDFNVQVKACVSAALIGTEKCRQYPDGNYKPIGLLQVYGENDLMRFGLMTGSYNKNISGGVLRKNIGVLTDEINLTTNGTFKTPPSTGNIIGTLNKMRIYGYNYGDGTYLSTAGDNCAFQLTNITEGNCRSWGNPMSEILYESLRYFAGKTPIAAYDYGTATTTADYILGLPRATWDTTLVNSTNYCAPLNVVVFNASVSTNDDDLRTTALTDINSTDTAEQKSNSVGDGEGITGTSRYVGKIVGTGATATGDTGFELCTAKTIPGLGQVSGICPEGPTLAGSYLLPGLAHHANTNRIRTDITAVPGTDTTSLKVKTYGVQLATNVPQIRIAVTGATTPRVIIQPAYRLVTAGGNGGGALVDMRIVSQTSTATTATGTIYLNWEDSEQGGDYDQDMWGVLSYSLDTVANTITVTTKTIAESTSQKQGFGYTISGTTQDGPHFHSGIENFDFTDPTNISISPGGYTNASGGCSTCNVGEAATTATYTLGTTSASSLEDPLFYASKWGGFTDSDSDGTPNLAVEYDKKNNTTGASTSDGIPDNYFLVSNPLYLETAMTKAFLAILATSSASAVATNSTSLKTNSLIFQAKFNSKDWSGQVLAYKIDSAGVISTTEEWDAGQRVNSQTAASRNIITLNPDNLKGMPFQWTNIDTLVSAAGIAQKTFLNKDGGGTADAKGEKRVNYLRGDQTYEGTTSGDFRQRLTSRLGDIVFSSPQYVGAPNDGHFESSYATFRSTYLTRNPVLYVGANDGMLHGFNACYPASTSPVCVTADQGKELIAYVPGKLYSNLSKLTDQTYSHKFFVDGSPTVNDAYGKIGQCGATDCWRTVLVSGLNAGGQGVFALDITDPTQFTDPGTNADKLLIWEFTNADDADLGYTYSKPIIARLSNGRWAAIFGNGYNSSSGTAALYVLYLDKTLGDAWNHGTNYFKIDTGCNTAATTCTPVAGGNGLSSVAGWDKDGDGNIDYVYGGDLQGNMWKFDISGTPSATPATGWKVAIGASAPYTPLFTAVDLVTPTANRQPITTAPAISAHPLSGMLVYFGTGQVLAPADVSDLKLQTFYAIWDKNDGSTVSGRSQLLEQSITSETGTNRITSANAMNWRTATSTSPDYLGWYMDLVVAPPPSISNMKGERHVGAPKLEGGAVLFNTFIPSTVACDFGGDGWLMAANYATGGLLPFPAFDTDSSGSITSADTPTGGKKVGAAIGGSTIIGGGGIPPTPPPTTCSTPPCPPPSCATPPCPPPPPPTPPSVCGSGTASFAASSTTGGGLNTTPLQLRGLCGRVTWRELIQN